MATALDFNQWTGSFENTFTNKQGKNMSFALNTKSKYKKEDLIKSLEKFKEAHVLDYNKALEVYYLDVKENVKKLNRLVDRKEFDKVYVSNNFGLAKPINCEKEYDKIINILKHVEDNEIELEFHDADSLLNDDWGSISSAKLLNSTYSSRNGR